MYIQYVILYCILCTVHRGHLLTMYASAYDVLISLKCCRLNANIELYIEQNHTPNQLRHFKSQYLLNVSRLCFAHMYNCTYIDCLIITTTKCWTVVDNTVLQGLFFLSIKLPIIKGSCKDRSLFLTIFKFTIVLPTFHVFYHLFQGKNIDTDYVYL